MAKTFTPTILDQDLVSYIKKVNSYPMLSEQEEQELASRVLLNQDIEAAHILVTSHLKLVVKIALKMRGYGLALMDLISEGSIGLMHAVKKFDQNMGCRLSTYATWWIKAAINEFIIKSWSLVKIGTTVSQKKLFFNLTKLKNKILSTHNRSHLSDDDIKSIATELSVSQNEVKDMNMRLGHDISLDQANSAEDDNSPTLLDTLSDSRDNAEILTLNKQDIQNKRTAFYSALDTLKDREKEIFLARYLNSPATTLEILSQQYNISRERVRQIESRAFDKVRASCLSFQS